LYAWNVLCGEHEFGAGMLEFMGVFGELRQPGIKSV
jgi:hypothetical protein